MGVLFFFLFFPNEKSSIVLFVHRSSTIIIGTQLLGYFFFFFCFLFDRTIPALASYIKRFPDGISLLFNDANTYDTRIYIVVRNLVFMSNKKKKKKSIKNKKKDKGKRTI